MNTWVLSGYTGLHKHDWHVNRSLSNWTLDRIVCVLCSHKMDGGPVQGVSRPPDSMHRSDDCVQTKRSVCSGALVTQPVVPVQSFTVGGCYQTWSELNMNLWPNSAEFLKHKTWSKAWKKMVSFFSSYKKLKMCINHDESWQNDGLRL